MRRRSFCALLGSPALASLAGCTASHPLPAPSGVVLDRRIHAGSETLFRHDDERVEGDPVVTDPVDDARIEVGADHDREIRADHGPVEYGVWVEHAEPTGVFEEPGEVIPYTVSRTVFNRVLLADEIRFSVPLTDHSEILSVSRISRVGRIAEKRVLDTDGEVLASTSDGAIADVGEEIGANEPDPDDTTLELVTDHVTDQRRVYEAERSSFESVSVGDERRLAITGAETVTDAHTT
jgi:hypothetical protein